MTQVAKSAVRARGERCGGGQQVREPSAFGDTGSAPHEPVPACQARKRAQSLLIWPQDTTVHQPVDSFSDHCNSSERQIHGKITDIFSLSPLPCILSFDWLLALGRDIAYVPGRCVIPNMQSSILQTMISTWPFCHPTNTSSSGLARGNGGFIKWKCCGMGFAVFCSSSSSPVE